MADAVGVCAEARHYQLSLGRDARRGAPAFLLQARGGEEERTVWLKARREAWG